MTSSLPARSSDRLMVLAAALLFSSGGAVVKLCSLTSWQVACLRSAIAAVALAILLPSSLRGWSWRTLLVGAAYAATMVGFVLANKLTTSANAVFLQSTAPLYVLLLGPLFLNEKVRRRDLFYMAALGAGLFLIVGGAQPQFATAPDPQRGNLIGALTGLFFALTIVGLRWLARTGSSASANPAAAATLSGNLVAAAATAPLALPIAGATPTDWGAVAFLGVFQIALAYIFLVYGVRRVGALEVSLLVLLEPVLNPVWTWLVHGEIPTPRAAAGGALIIVATGLYTWVGSRKLQEPVE